ncbi:RagB/SusD family nutrient uptake outer membrane protein [Mariniphaga sediminis]|uniref:RagB/SusD family nutrient uptake outer membrane protein n=1 Tax=Mariniphaga sediminis TaxID=1628158 RepID=UPI003565F2DE
MKIKLLNIVTIFILGFFLDSCSESWLGEDPPHRISAESVYTSLDGFETGINGTYSLVRLLWHDSDSRGYFFRGGTDSFTGNFVAPTVFGGMFEYWKDTNTPQRPNNESFFLWLYQIVNAANTIISRAGEGTDINWTGGDFSADENKNRIIGEAKALRAWAYRHLSYGWGDVPLVFEESKGTTIRTDWERTPVEEVRRQIISDLLFAEKFVPVEPLPGRFSKGAVQHYLAEMYLTIDKPDSTLFWANKCINTPNYKLITERYGVKENQPGVAFMDMFEEGNRNREEGNTEALWVIQYDQFVPGGGQNRSRRGHMSKYHQISVNGIEPFQYTLERGGRGQCRFAFTKWALDIYESQDDRFSHYAIRKFLTINDAETNAPYPADRLPPGYSYGDTIWFDWSQDITFETRNRFDWPWSKKVDGALPENPSSSNYYGDKVELRLADTYLLKAEAQFKLGYSSDAAETINIIRRRSGASDVSAGDISIDFILDERSRELFLEEERRWTLLRTDKWMERTQLYNHNGGQNITERDKLFPIPQSVIDANLTKEMSQNPGY